MVEEANISLILTSLKCRHGYNYKLDVSHSLIVKNFDFGLVGTVSESLVMIRLYATFHMYKIVSFTAVSMKLKFYHIVSFQG